LKRKVLVIGCIIVFLGGCLPPVSREPLPPEKPSLYAEQKFVSPLTDDADRSSLQTAVERSLAHLAKKCSAGNTPAGLQGIMGNLFSPERLYRSLTIFREILRNAPDEVEFERRVREAFALWEVVRAEGAKPILLTGYYEPVVEGQLKPGGEYLYPIYRRPEELAGMGAKDRSAPYYSRKEIDCQGALRGKGYELAWLKDPWERYVLQVQGSGQLRLPDGRMLRVGFAASNGRPYRSIGRYLVERGFLTDPELSLSRVQEFLRQHPERRDEVFNANERYIFFRVIPGKEGPVGALGFPLTAGRSVATDPTVFPPGALAYVIAQQPAFDEAGKLKARKTLRRFVLNQDTGAAMKGPERVDFFCGSGEVAGKVAGAMREEGKIYFLQAK
jgi:membrane-bound lytic murein transglycosylase A